MAVVAGDRVLVKDQTDGTENGIYDVAVGDWARAKDFNSDNEIAEGLIVNVNSGTNSARVPYILTATDPVLGTS